MGPAERLAEGASLVDRMVYRGLMEAAERRASESGLVVCGRAATRLLLGDPADPDLPPPVGLDSFQCEFAGGEAPRQAKALTDALWEADPEGLGHYAMMLSKVPGQLMLVLANGRTLFSVQSLPTLRGAPIAEVLTPTRRPAQFARDEAGEPLMLPCFGPELQLIGTYAALSNPSKAPSWGDLMSEEAALRALYYREAEEKHALAISRNAELRRVRGGGAPSGEEALGLAARAGPDTGRLRRALLDHYAAGPGRVLVGPYAVAAMIGGGAAAQGRVQVVAAGSLEEEVRAAKAVVQRLGFSAEWATNDPKCPVDTRLRRATVYVTRVGGREPVLDIFNSAAHELVPYATVASWEAVRGDLRPRTLRDGGGEKEAGNVSNPDPALLKIGTPFVLMRFLLTDMWTIQVLLRMGAVSGGYAEEVLGNMLRDFKRVAGLYTELLALCSEGRHLAGAGACVLPLAHGTGAAYVGRLEDPELAQRREAASRPDQRRYPAYYAAAARHPRDGAPRDGAPPAQGGGPPPARGLRCEEYAPSRSGSASAGLTRRAGWDDALGPGGEDY